MNLKQRLHELSVSIPQLEASGLQVHQLTGRERISSLSRLKVTVSVDDDELHRLTSDSAMFARQLVGTAAAVEWLSGGAPVRAFWGSITKARCHVRSQQQRAILQLTLRPRLHQLKLRSASRCFREQSVLDTVRELLAEHGVPCRLDVTRPIAVRDLTVQYRETDYAFVKRLLAEEGLFFFFEHAQLASPGNDRDTLVIADSPQAYPWISGERELQVRSGQLGSALHGGDSYVDEFATISKDLSKAVRLRSRDFRHPLRQMDTVALVTDAQQPSSTKIGSNYAIIPALLKSADELRAVDVHHSEYEERDYDESEVGVLLERVRRDALTATARTTCGRLLAGHRFIVIPEGGGASDQWVTVSLEHETHLDAGGDGPDQPSWRCRLRCVPATVPYRPPVGPPRIMHTGETATVVGPPNTEIHTDGYGRVKVQFHWDRRGHYDDNSSCWVRVAQWSAGSRWGHQHIPRIGSEVFVTFVAGDPDRPLITGSLYNRTHLPPFELPAEATRTGFRSRSTPKGAGYNELSFDDQRGAEQVYLRAERELRQHVGQDAWLTVNNHRHVNVRGDEHVQIGNDRWVQASRDHTLSVARNSRHVTGGSLASDVGENLEERVTGSVLRESHDSLTVVAQHAAVQTGRDYSLSVGSAVEGGNLDVSVRGNGSIMAHDHLYLIADKQIELICGDSRLTMGPNGIRVNGVRLALAGGEQISLRTDDTEVQFDGSIAVMADTVKLKSSGATVMLDADARIDGAKVLLNCGANAPLGSQEAQADQPLTPLRMIFVDDRGQPYSNCQYELVCGGRRYLGTTDGSGGVSEQVLSTATQATLDLWPAAVGAERLSWQLELGDIEPVSTLNGMQARLQNLGYYHGPIDGLPSTSTNEALAAFQKDNDLTPSGKEDEETLALLEAKHR